MALFGAKRAITETDEGDSVRKECLYFRRGEYINRLKVTGQKYLHYMEIQTNKGDVHKIGHRKSDDHDCEFELTSNFKIIAFAGVIEVLVGECRMLNFTIYSKEVEEECSTADVQ